MINFLLKHPFLVITTTFFLLGVCMSLSTWANGGKGWVLLVLPLESLVGGIIIYIVFVRNAYKK